ncbi:uncharacterized protein SRS1_15979 [Sporisorium reilianum f. sp. reilianum]|uniref:Uncharacterized protein n=1 Tax=Sporisorium reilianum f. sp. reilianum TaxID=72559 RepID=A0A2N8UNW6_9BASI|nr:uncharacterized protein SRS1_15979 [Sporisorium reilianum f. sp. reilianum]
MHASVSRQRAPQDQLAAQGLCRGSGSEQTGSSISCTMPEFKTRSFGTSGGPKPDLSNTGYWVAFSAIVSMCAVQAISVHGVKGMGGSLRMGVLSFCAGTWIGVYRSGTPLSNGEVLLPEFR